MIIIRHRLSPLAWEFDANQGDLRGGGRTLQECVASSEAAVREHFAAAQGRDGSARGGGQQFRHDVDAAVLTA